MIRPTAWGHGEAFLAGRRYGLDEMQPPACTTTSPHTLVLPGWRTREHAERKNKTFPINFVRLQYGTVCIVQNTYSPNRSQVNPKPYPKPKCTVQEQPSGGVFGLGGGGGAHAPPASLPPTHLQSNGTACTLVYGRHRSPHRPPSVTHHPCIMTSLDHLTTRARLDLSRRRLL